ncbi:hypothetical protein MHBO_000850 [Bonamia ostreae]|uniref:Uncharacterized protein n=1 Tax=Bonamia ostreae TaxID=126728 RepID=A0ABV2AI92_9EUKA
MTDSDSTANLKNENSTLPTKNIERLNRQNILRTEEDREEKEMIEHCERQMVQIKGNLVVLRRKMEEKIRLRRLMNENHATLQLLIKYQKELNEPLGKNIRSRVEDGGLKFSGGVVVPVPVHFIEAQTLLLQEQVAVQSANLSKSQRILRNQMELFRQFQLLQQQKL